jgi:hypothetical protein
MVHYILQWKVLVYTATVEEAGELNRNNDGFDSRQWQGVQTGSGVHPASYPTYTGAYFLGCKTAGV